MSRFSWYSEDEIMTEGHKKIDGILKDTSGIEADKIRKAWKDNNTSGPEKLKTTYDKGIKPAADTADAIDRFGKQLRVDNRSIIARTKNSILQFPVYISQSLRVNEAHIIAELFDRTYASYVQSMLSMNPIIDEDEVNNMRFLKGFHANLKESTDLEVSDLYDTSDELSKIIKESAFYEEKISPRCTIRFSRVNASDYPNLIAENTRLMNEPLYGFSYLKETTTKETRTTGRDHIMTDDEIREIAIGNAKLSNEERRYIDMTTAEIEDYVLHKYPEFSTMNAGGHIAGRRGDEETKTRTKTTTDVETIDDATTTTDAGNRRNREPQEKRNVKTKTYSSSNEKNRNPKFRNAVKEILDMKDDAEDKVNDEIRKWKKKVKNNDPTKDKYYYKDGQYHRLDSEKSVSTKSDGIQKAPERIKAVDAPQLLHDSDIKKINGMLPYTINASFIIRSATGGLEREVHFIIGVKSVMHVIRVQDLEDELRDIVTGKIKSLQKVRYKTGEIGFMDYVFNRKQLKADAAKNLTQNKRWINNLKRLSDFKRTNGSFLKTPIGALNKGDTPIPNATLILTQTDVTLLSNSTGIDLTATNNAKRLCSSLFLIAFAIVDPSAGSMRILFPDMGDSWDVQSLASVDAELAKTDNSQIMKELNKMVNR